MQHDVIGFRFERVNLSYCIDHHDESAIESISCMMVSYTHMDEPKEEQKCIQHLLFPGGPPPQY